MSIWCVKFFCLLATKKKICDNCANNFRIIHSSRWKWFRAIKTNDRSLNQNKTKKRLQRLSRLLSLNGRSQVGWRRILLSSKLRSLIDGFSVESFPIYCVALLSISLTWAWWDAQRAQSCVRLTISDSSPFIILWLRNFFFWRWGSSKSWWQKIMGILLGVIHRQLWFNEKWSFLFCFVPRRFVQESITTSNNSAIVRIFIISLCSKS